MRNKSKKPSREMPRVTVRVPRTVLTRLQTLADADRRTESDYHRKVLIDHIEAQDAKKAS